MKNYDHKEIAELLEGKTIKSAQVAVKSVVIHLEDGTFLDVYLDQSNGYSSTSLTTE